MRKITLLFPYYENPGMLRRQLENIASYPKEIKQNLELIVVDDGSPRYPAEIRFKPGVANLRLFRTLVDVRWNQDFCRNLAAHHAAHDWILMTDIDHLIPAETMLNAMKIKLDSYTAYKFSRKTEPGPVPYKEHPNTWLMTKEVFWHVGGYDERFAGYYGTDGDFAGRVKRFVRGVVQLNYFIIRVPRDVTPDASTTTYARKSAEDGAMVRKIKDDRAKEADPRPRSLSFPWKEIELVKTKDGNRVTGETSPAVSG